MMKTMLLTGAALLTAVTVTEAAEIAGAGGDAAPAGSFYVSGKAGMNLLDDLDAHFTRNYTDTRFREKDSFKTGWLLAGAAGWKQGYFRAEGEIEYATNEWDESSMSISIVDPPEFGPGLNFDSSGSWYALSVFGTIYLDFDNRTKLTPFLFGGIGGTMLGWDERTISYRGREYFFGDESELVFAWKLGAGVAWHMRDNIFLDLTYRYMNTNTASISNTNGGYDYTSHALSLGGRYQF